MAVFDNPFSILTNDQNDQMTAIETNDKITKFSWQNIRKPQCGCCIFAVENITVNVGTANKLTPMLSCRFTEVQAALEAPSGGTAATPRGGVN